MCRLTDLVECVHQSEGLRRNAAWEHGVLQQRAAGEAPLDEPADVCVLMHVGATQANTRMYQDRQRVLTADQVRDACCSRGMSCPLTQSSLLAYCGGGCSTRIYVDSGKYRGLVRLCGVMRWAPANALPLPVDILVVELRQIIHTLRSSLCILYSCTRPPPCAPTFSPLLLVYIHVYKFHVYVYMYVYIYMYIEYTTDMHNMYIYICMYILSVTPALLLVYSLYVCIMCLWSIYKHIYIFLLKIYSCFTHTHTHKHTYA